MAHKMIGESVDFMRPTVVKPGYRKLNEDTGNPEEIPAVVEMKEIPATVIGVEPRQDASGKSLSPNLHLAFLHPDRLHHLGGSGWRDAFDRAISVRPASHPDVIDSKEKIPCYVNLQVDQELSDIRAARKAAQDKADAEAKAKKDKEAADAEAKRKADADAKAKKEKEENDAKAKKTADDKAAADKAAADKAAADKKEPAKADK